MVTLIQNLLAAFRSHWVWAALLSVIFWLSLSLGAAASDLSLPWQLIKHLIWEESQQPQMMDVVLQIRLPRAILAVLVGAVLAVSGASLQGLSRNPLADPGLLGISAGAAVAAAFGFAFKKFLPLSSAWQVYYLPVLAFVGAALTALLIHRLAQSQGRIQIVTLLLAGIALNALFAALIGLVTYLANDQSLRMITYWLMGSLAGASWDKLAIATPLVLIAIWGIFRQRKALNLLLLGEANAKYMGVAVDQVKKRLLWFNALAVGVAVSVSGIIGFVGLVIPHLLRLLMGSDYRHLLFKSFWLGGAYLLLADTVARMVIIPAEVPIGIITSLLGAPVFISLLVQQKKRLGGGV